MTEVNKVIFGGSTLLDLTAVTVAPSLLASGVTAHDASGNLITGTGGGGGGGIESAAIEWIEGTLSVYSSADATYVRPSAASIGRSVVTAVDFPNVSVVDQAAFAQCAQLSEVRLDTVKTIASGAFSACTSLTNLFAPAVETLGGYAFYQCSRLTGLNAPSLASVGRYAFTSCQALHSVTFDNAVYIGSYAFASCYSLSGRLNLAKTSFVGSNAFFYCSNVSGVTTGSSTYIGDMAFAYTGLSGQYVSVRCSGMGEYPFYGCSGITGFSAYVYGGTISPVFRSVEMSSLEYFHLIRAGSSGFQLSGYVLRYLPFDIDLINECDSLTWNSNCSFRNIYFPYASTALPSNIFNQKSYPVDFEAPVEAVGPSAFWSNSSAKNVYLTSSCVAIGAHAFEKCSADVGFDGAALYIGSYAFAGSKSRYIPAVLGAISEYAFSGVSFASSYSYKGSWYKSYTYITASIIQQNAFAGTTMWYPAIGADWGSGILSYGVTVHANGLPSTIRTLNVGGLYAWRYVPSTYGTVSSLFPYLSTATFTLEGDSDTYAFSVAAIASSAFKQAPALSSVRIENYAPGIEVQVKLDAFASCSALSYVYLYNEASDGNIYLYGSAFYSCSNLKDLVLDGVGSIGGKAFAYCTALTSVALYNGRTIGANAFQGCTSLSNAYVEATTLASMIFSGCTALERLQITLPESNSTQAVYSTQWSGCSKLASVDLVNIPYLPPYTFRSCSSLNAVYIAGSHFGYISTSAFYNCTKLSYLDLWVGGLSTKLSSGLFYGCGSLSSVYLFNGASSIVQLLNSSAFNYLPASYKVFVPSQVYSLYVADSVWSHLISHVSSYNAGTLPW